MDLPAFHLRRFTKMQHQADYEQPTDPGDEMPANYGVAVPEEVRARERWHELDELMSKPYLKDYQVGLLITLKQEYQKGNYQG